MSTNDGFFQRRKPAAAFKHGILSRYPVIFASKAGSRAIGKRVTFLDGYAGPGQYKDGTVGSPLLFMEAAKSMKDRRQVTAVFVEADEANFQRLAELLSATAPPDASYRTVPGDLGLHLQDIVDKAAGTALFAFLDPFGTALDRYQLCRALLTPARRAPVEVLLHFSVLTVARIGGLLRKAQPLRENDRKTVANVDRFLGGDWWHDSFRAIAGVEDEGAATTAALEVADRYCREVGEQTGFRPVAIPVRPAPGRRPKYVLVLFTRHPHGLWHFTDTLGKAGRDWMQAHHDEQIRERLKKEAAQAELIGEPLFPLEPDQFDPVAYEHEHSHAWVGELAENITQLLHKHGSFLPVDHTTEIYGKLIGQAWGQHVRLAVKMLHEAGITSNDGKNDKESKKDYWERPLDIILPVQGGPTTTNIGARPRAVG